MRFEVYGSSMIVTIVVCVRVIDRPVRGGRCDAGCERAPAGRRPLASTTTDHPGRPAMLQRPTLTPPTVAYVTVVLTTLTAIHLGQNPSPIVLSLLR